MEGKRFGEAKNAIKKNRELAQGYGEDQADFNKGERGWGLYDMPLNSFGASFRYTLPRTFLKNYDSSIRAGEIFTDYLKESLGTPENKVVGVELGGPGSRLFEDMKGLFQRSAGVCLKDIRSKFRKDADIQNQHIVLEGDILDPKNNMPEEVLKGLGTSQVDCVISRMFGPLVYISKNPLILDRFVRNWYRVLSPKGLMFLQFNFNENEYKGTGPKNTEVFKMITAWANKIREIVPEIDVQLEEVEGVIRIQKKPGAPEELPPLKELFPNA